jgi:hypothetical protein
MKKIYLITVLTLLISSLSNSQSIPNNGFETWTNTSGYNIPASWGTMNPYTTSTSIYTCTKGTPGITGSTAAYIKLVSKSVTGMGIVPGMAVSGVLNSDKTYDSGFSFNYRPTSLNGSWQYMGSGSDVGFVKILMTRINPTTLLTETIGSGIYNLSGMVMSWTTFSIPITYTTADTPDHCQIVLSSSGSTPVANSYLYVDNLNFTMPLKVNEFNINNVEIYPNPSKGIISIDYSKVNDKVQNIEVIDMIGNKVINDLPNENQLSKLNIDFLSNGIYLLKIKTENGDITKKIIKQ